MQDGNGRVFREAWIDGVRKHYQGEPKPSYVAPWEETSAWERASATAVYEQVCVFIRATGGHAVKLARTQKGMFITVCWAGQVLRYLDTPNPSGPAGWDELPEWQRETNADIFERIEQDLAGPHA